MGKRGGKARGRGGNRNDWDETSSGGFQQSGEMSGSPQNQRGGGKQRKGRNAPGGFGKGAFNNGTGGAFNNGTDGAFNNGTDGAFNNGTDGGFNNGSGFDGGFSKLGGNGFNTEDYSVNDEQKHQEFQDVPNPFGGSGDCQPVIRSRSSSIAANEVNNFGGFGGSVPCRQGSRSRQSSVCRGGEENEIDIADQDLEEELNFGGSRHSIASRRMSVGSRNEFGTGSSRLSLNSRALGPSSRNVPGQSLADLNGAANFGGTGFNEGFERFSKHHASVRSVQHDEHSGTHRLSKLSINTNADEFVLVGGHPPGGVDGRGSVHSTRSVQSRMSLRRSTDYLAGGHDNIGNGEPLRPASALSRQSEEGDVICESGSDGGEEVFVDAHQNPHCDTTTVPTIMLNSRPLSACSKVSVHSGYDVDNVGTSPDYVTAAGGNSRSRTSSRRSENGFGGEEAGQFGGFGEQDQLSTGRRSTHASRQSMNAGGFGGEDAAQFGGSRNDFVEQDQLSTGRRSTHASRQSMNAGGFGGEEAGQFGGSRNDFGEQNQLSTGRRSTHASRQSMNAGGFGGEEAGQFGGSRNDFGEQDQLSTGRRSTHASRQSMNAGGFGGEEVGQFGGSRNDFGEQDQLSTGRKSTHASRQSMNAGGFGGEEAGQFGGSRNDFGEQDQLSTGRRSTHASRQSMNAGGFGGEEAGQFGGSRNDFGEQDQLSTGRRSTHASRQSMNAGGFGGEEAGQFGGSRNDFGEQDQLSTGRRSTHASRQSMNAGGFGGEEVGQFGGSRNDFGEQDQLSTGRKSTHASRQSMNAGGFGGEEAGQFGGSRNDFGEQDQLSTGRRSTHASRQSMNAGGFGGEEVGQFGGSRNDFGEQDQLSTGRKSTHASRQSMNAGGFGGEEAGQFGGSRNDFGEQDQLSTGRRSTHASRQSMNAGGFGGEEAGQFGGSRNDFGEQDQLSTGRRSTHASRQSMNAGGFGGEEVGQFGGSRNDFGEQDQLSTGRKSTHASRQSMNAGGFGGEEAGQFGGSRNDFGEQDQLSTGRRSTHASRQSMNAGGFGGEEAGQFGGSRNDFGEQNQLSTGRRSTHASRQSMNAGGFGGEEAGQFGGSRNDFGERDQLSTGRRSTHASRQSMNAGGFGGEDAAQFGGSRNDFGEQDQLSTGRRSTHASRQSMNAGGFGGEEAGQFGGFGEQDQLSTGRRSTHASRQSMNAGGFGGEEAGQFGGSRNDFGEQNQLSTGRRSTHASRQSMNAGGFRGEEAGQFGGSRNDFGEQDQLSTGRRSTHASRQSMNSGGFGGEEAGQFGGSRNDFGEQDQLSTGRRSTHASRQSMNAGGFGGEEAGQFGGSRNDFGEQDQLSTGRRSTHASRQSMNAGGFGGEEAGQFGGSRNDFGEQDQLSTGRRSTHASRQSMNAGGFGGEEAGQFGGFGEQDQLSTGRRSTHASRQSMNAGGFGGEEAGQFGGFGEQDQLSTGRRSTHASRQSMNAGGFGGEEAGQFGGSRNDFGEQNQLSTGRRSTHASRQSMNAGGFRGEEAGQFGGSRNDFGEQDQLSTGRRSTHASRQSMNSGGFGGEEAGQFGGSRNDFGEQDQLSTGRRSTHASRQSMNAGGFGGEEAGQFGGSRNDFGEQDQLSTGRRSTHASRQSMNAGGFGGEEAGQFGGSRNDFGEQDQLSTGRRSTHASRQSMNAGGFGGEEVGQFGGSRNDFGEQDQLSTGRKSTHASRQSMNAGGFGGEEVGQFGGSRNDFGEQDQLSTGRRSTHASRQSMNAGGFGGEEAGQFGGSRNDFGEQDQLSTGRRSTHASRQSMFSGAGLGNDTDEHLMVAQFNSNQESHQDLRQSVHDVAGSRISIVTPPDVLTRAGSRVSMGGVPHSTTDMTASAHSSTYLRGFNSSKGLWFYIPRVELGMSSSKEGRGRNLSERQTQPRSRTVSCSSHADREAVDFAAVPELYSHPDDRFDSQEEGEPFRPTREHEKTPPAAARATTSNDADLNQEIVIGTSEHTAPQPPIPRSRTVSRSSLSQDAPTAVSRNPSMRSVTGVAAPMISTNALTPLSSRNDCNVDPSPLMHDQNQTQVDRRKLESRIHHQLKPKVCSEIGIQTGDTIRLRQGTDSGTLESLAAQPAPVEERVKMAQFGRTRPSFNNSFERKEHPAASVLTSMLQRRTDSSQSSCQSSSLSSQQVTIIHNNQQDNQVRQESLQQQNVHQYETRTQQNWSSNTRSHWQPASNEVGQDEIVVPVELQQHQWTTEQSKHILPREAAEQMRQQVIQESRTQTTPKSSRASRSAEDFESHAQVRKETTAAPNINWRTERNSSQRSGVTKMNGSQNSQFKWTVNDPRDSLVREPDVKWVASLEKEPGRTVRQNVPVGKIRDIASMFNTMQNKAEKEAAVLVMKSKKGLVRRERRQSEPSLNGSMVEYQETRYTSRPQDPRYYKEQHSNFHSREEPVNGLQNQVSRGRAGVWDHSDWNCENDLNGALLDVNDDSDRDSRVDLRRTSTPLSGHFDHREAMAAKFHRVPSIRAEAHHVVTRQSRPSQRGEVRSIAASFERSASNSPPSQQRDVRRPSSVVQRPSYHNQYSQEISEGVPRTSQRDSERSHLSRQNSIHHRRSYSMQPVKRQMEVDFSAEEESPYAQVSRGNSQQPRELASRDYGGAGDYASLASNQQRQSLSRFDDIAEENVIGHIDNLFDFVQDHEAPVDGGRPVCIPLNKPPPPPKMPLNYSVSAYREIQRHNRIPNEQAPVRFSPSVAPNIGELSHSNRSAHHHKQSFNQASMQSVRSQFGGCPADLVTSTPRESPRLAKKTAGYSAQDASFVSSITEGSQRMENHIDYKKQANKLSHHIEINREQIGMTEKVLSQARKEKKPLQELSAQRTLLVARERVALLDRELKRVLALSQAKHKPPPLNQDLRGSMDISNITVQLNRNFCQRHNDLNSSYAFVVLLKCGSEVEATAPVTLLASHQHRLRQVHFAEKVNFGNIPVDFNVQVEVYTMVLPDRRSEESSCATTIANKCRSLLVPARRPIRSANGLPVGEFVRCGYLQLNRDTTGCSKFYLDEAEYPLEGTMEVHTRCTTLPPSIEVDYRSFLTMYQCISGIGSWERYWAVLRRGMVYFWKYPEDESMNRAPKAHLDLASCTRDELAPCTPEQCPRPYSFCVDVLVATAPSVMDRKRVLLSADSRDMMNAWLDAMNETLSIIRG